MRKNGKILVALLFLLGVWLTTILGASTSQSFIWPGYTVIGITGVLTILLLFTRTRFRVPGWCFAAIFLTTLYFLVRSMDSYVFYFGREDASLVVACFVIYAVFMSAMAEVRFRSWLFWSLIGFVVLELGLGLLQKLTTTSLWIFPGYHRTFTDRIGGTFNHPDHFAGYLAALIPLLLASVVFGKHSRNVRIGLSILAMAAFTAILVSKSMVGTFVAIAGIGLFFLVSLFLIWKRLNSGVRKFLLIALPLLAVTFASSLYLFRAPLESYAKKEVLMKDNQVYLPAVWRSAWKQYQESPVVGTGSRSFYYFSRRFGSMENDKSGAEPEFAHNEYLQVLADYGIIGAGVLGLLLLLHLGKGFQFVNAYARFPVSYSGNPLPQSDYLAMTIGAICGLGVILLQASVDFVLHAPSFALLATLFLALLACPDPLSATASPAKRSYLPGGPFLFGSRAAAFGSGAILAFIGIILTRSESNYEQARKEFSENNRSPELFAHLQKARELDPCNPFAFSLSAHAHVAAIEPGMAEPARIAALEKAEGYFTQAQKLYPFDIFAAVGHSAVLDQLNRPEEALEVLQDAREWAPRYGNLMVAEAEHFLRQGRMDRAEESFLAARTASVLGNLPAANAGLESIRNWRRSLIPSATFEEKTLSGAVKALPKTTTTRPPAGQ